MGKLVFWIVVFFAILLVVRIVNLSKAKAREEEASRRGGNKLPPAEPTVRCVACGVYVPKSESMPVPNGHRCSPDCTRPH